MSYGETKVQPPSPCTFTLCQVGSLLIFLPWFGFKTRQSVCPHHHDTRHQSLRLLKPLSLATSSHSLFSCSERSSSWAQLQPHQPSPTSIPRVISRFQSFPHLKVWATLLFLGRFIWVRMSAQKGCGPLSVFLPQLACHAGWSTIPMQPWIKIITKEHVIMLKVYVLVGSHYWLSWAVCSLQAAGWTCLI